MSEKSTVSAWLLEVAPAVQAILPRQSMGHLLDDFELSRVPQAPEYARNVYFWNDQIVPVFNLSALVLGHAEDASLLGIVAYRRGAEIKQGALALFAPPRLVEVPDELAGWPEGACPWPELGDCCVKLERADCVILSPDKLFSYDPTLSGKT